MVVSIGTRREQWQAEQKKGKVLTMIKIYYTNLGLYNEGILAGEWVELPISDEELEEVRSRCGFDETHEEYFITDYETDIDGLRIGEYDSLEYLNRLAEVTEENETTAAALIYFGYDTPEEIESHIDDVFYVTTPSGCESEENAVGYYYAEELGALEIPENLKCYFDYEAYGRDIMLEGNFYTAENGDIYECVA